MPRKAKDYSKALVYKLCCLDPTIKEIYVGSTTSFTKRKYKHKHSCKNEKQYKVYQYIRANGNWENWNMVLIEYFPCETELELGRRENYWKQELQSSLNSCSPPMYETKDEYNKKMYEANKEYHKQKNKERYEANKEEILEKTKEYREADKEKWKKYDKERYEANKEKIKEKVKEYREKNKEAILEKNNQKYTCECGKVYTHNHRARHFRTKVHQKHLAENPDK